MKEQEITAISLDNPSLNLPETSYGFSNEPLGDTQLKIRNNRDIYRSQYFALDVFGSSGTADNMFRDILPMYMGENKKGGKAMVAPIISGLGDIIYTTSLNYTTDHFGSYVALVQPTCLIEIYARFVNNTELIKVNYTGNMRSLKSVGGNPDIMNNTNNHIILMNTGTTHNKITIQYATSASDVPRFGIFMKVIY